MFYSITGKVIHTDAGSVVLEAGGIGYRLTVSGRTLGYAADGASKGDVRLYTYLSVREDGIELFGFRDESELDLYKKLISVSGVGPKMGIALLSALSPEEIALAVGGGDYRMLTCAGCRQAHGRADNPRAARQARSNACRRRCGGYRSSGSAAGSRQGGGCGEHAARARLRQSRDRSRAARNRYAGAVAGGHYQGGTEKADVTARRRSGGMPIDCDKGSERL